MGLIMACYGGLWGILSGLTKSTDHPSIYVGPQSRYYLHAWRPRVVRDLDLGRLSPKRTRLAFLIVSPLTTEEQSFSAFWADSSTAEASTVFWSDTPNAHIASHMFQSHDIATPSRPRSMTYMCSTYMSRGASEPGC